MGRLLDALRTDSETAKSANPANPAKLPDDPPEDSQIRKIRNGGDAETRAARIAKSQESQRLADMRAHLLALAAADHLPADLVHALPDADVITCKDETDATLTAYLRALQASRDMDQGLIPQGWGGAVAASCEHCGPVWLWPGAPARVLWCPWCFRRMAGKWIPRPKVNCRDCKHFIPNARNPQAGGGDCSAGHDGRWPMQLHRCDAWRPKDLVDG